MAQQVGRAIGIDIGGTNLRAGVVDADGTISEVQRRDNPVPVGGETDPDALVRAIVAVVRDLDVAAPVGIGIAALVQDDGWVTYAPNLAIRPVGLGTAVAHALGTSVSVGNDATLAGLAEHRVGAGVGVADMAMVTLGTGVGGAIISGGAMVRGASGFAGELGHVVVDISGPVCACGQQGCLEAYASGTAIERAASDGLGSPDVDSSLRDVGTIRGRDVVVAAGAGDAYAIGVLERAGTWLGIGLAVIANVLDPGRLVVGGGVAQAAGPWLLPAARLSLASRLMGGSGRVTPEVVPAALGDDAGMIGAGMLAMDSTA